MRILRRCEGAPFEAIFVSNKAPIVAAIREAIAEWGPYMGLEIRDKGKLGIVLGTEDPRALAGLIDGLRRLHASGWPSALEAAEEIMAGTPDI